MKFYLSLLSFLVFVSIGLAFAQDANEGMQDTAVEERADDSSAFQDSIKYDDMDPIFYEAEEEVAAPEPSNSMSMGLIIGIVALVVVVIIFLIRRSSKKSGA